MTNWRLEIKSTLAERIMAGEQTAIVRYDKGNDFQKGDTINFDSEGMYPRGPWLITHVIKNQNGVVDEYAVLCLQRPDAGYYEDRAETLSAALFRAGRSNAALRGQITKLRKKLGKP